MSSAKPKPVATGDPADLDPSKVPELPGIAEPASPAAAPSDGPQEEVLPGPDPPARS
jgi:hypothetical protein